MEPLVSVAREQEARKQLIPPSRCSWPQPCPFSYTHTHTNHLLRAKSSLFGKCSFRLIDWRAQVELWPTCAHHQRISTSIFHSWLNHYLLILLGSQKKPIPKNCSTSPLWAVLSLHLINVGRSSQPNSHRFGNSKTVVAATKSQPIFWGWSRHAPAMRPWLCLLLCYKRLKSCIALFR